MNAVLAAIFAYVGLQIVIGAWVARGVRTEADYLIAGRQLGVMLAATSIFATWFGAEVVMGAASRVYSNGLSGAQAEPFAYAVGIMLTGAFFAARLWRRGIQTFADFFRWRFSASVERLAAVLLIPGSVLWAAAQIRGFGQIVGSAAGIELTTAITIAAIAVVAYTVLGGLLADVYTDFIQGIVIVAGLVGLLVVVLGETGGLGPALAKVEAARLRFLAPEQTWLEILEKWAIPICGSIVAVELISRLLAARSPEVARRAAGLGGAAYLLIAMIPVTIGLLGPALVPGLADPEQLVPEIARSRLPTALYVLFVGALISAVLSSVDSALLAAGGLLSHNLLVRLRRDLPEARRVAIARGSVATLGIVAYLLALRAGSISDLVETASAFASAGIFVALVFGLFTRIGGPLSALAAMIAGALVWLVTGSLLGSSIPYLAGLGAATAAYLLVSIFEPTHRAVEVATEA